jgi:hypothetical protein
MLHVGAGRKSQEGGFAWNSYHDLPKTKPELHKILDVQKIKILPYFWLGLLAISRIHRNCKQCMIT